MAERIRRALGVPVPTATGNVAITVFVGAASTADHPGLDARALLDVADAAMYQVKRLRRRERSLPDPVPERSSGTAWLAQVRSVYQPIVDLDTRVVIGYEALARGPQGTALRTPEALFAAARAQGLVADLDWVCRLAALSGAVHAQLPSTPDLYVNAEPEALHAAPRAAPRRCWSGRRACR